jgi:hypothetical protein
MLILDEYAQRGVKGELVNSRVKDRVSIGDTKVIDSTIRGRSS